MMNDQMAALKGRFPLSDPLYDVIAALYTKSKALEVYEKYMSDLQSDAQLRRLFVEIRHDEIRHIEKLKAHIGRLLAENNAA